MEKHSDLTIILTLKDRIPFTYRWMRYMNDMKCPYKILIADGGEDKSIEEHLLNPCNYPALDYEYIRYPYDNTIEDYYKKFVNVVSRVQTKYLLLADNDDFYLLDLIPEILEFLDTNKDYVGCRGQTVDLTLFSRLGKSNGLVKGDQYQAVVNEALSIENDCPLERVETLCRDTKFDYYTNWYCIFRSASFQEVWKILGTLPSKEPMIMEVLTLVLMTIKGKIKIISRPYYIRQSNTSMHGGTLIYGNEFLERCIINNALSDLGLAIDQFAAVENNEQLDRVLRAIAGWLEITVSKIYFNRLRIKTSLMFRLRKKANRFPLLGPLLVGIYYRIAHLFLPIRQRKPVQLKSIKLYIIN